MKKNNKGFILFESLIASSIILMLVITFIPMISILNKEKVKLSEKLQFITLLHDELQPLLWSPKNEIPTKYTKQIGQKNVTFNFTQEHDLIKGCVEWENAKNEIETKCLYGYPEQ